MTWPRFDSAFSTETMTAVFSPSATVDALLAFEASLALALADVGMAPADESVVVAAACEQGVDDPESVLATWWVSGTPIGELRSQVADRIEDEKTRQWLHFGATTQDAVDTAASMQARLALDALLADLMDIAGSLRDLTTTHRSTAQMGRTFLQEAAPVTFGFRTATWLDAVLDHIAELRTARAGITVQLGGPTGTRSKYGAKGRELVEALARRLELQPTSLSRQSLRAEVLSRAQAVQRAAAAIDRHET